MPWAAGSTGIDHRPDGRLIGSRPASARSFSSRFLRRNRSTEAHLRGRAATPSAGAQRRSLCPWSEEFGGRRIVEADIGRASNSSFRPADCGPGSKARKGPIKVIAGKNVLITGSSGFIGRALISALVNRGNHLTLIDKVARASIDPEAQVIVGDLTDSKTIRQVAGPIDIIFAFGSPSSIELFNQNLQQAATETLCGFLNVMEFASQRRVERVVYPSSGTVYSNDAGTASKELSPINIYGVLKLTHERIAATYSSQVKSVGLRIFMGYGPGEEAKGPTGSPVVLFLRDALAGRSPVVWGDGSQARDMVFIDDIVATALTAAERDIAHSTVDVGTGKNTTFNEMIRLISHATGRSVVPSYVPAP